MIRLMIKKISYIKIAPLSVTIITGMCQIYQELHTIDIIKHLTSQCQLSLSLCLDAVCKYKLINVPYHTYSYLLMKPP